MSPELLGGDDRRQIWMCRAWGQKAAKAYMRPNFSLAVLLRESLSCAPNGRYVLRIVLAWSPPWLDCNTLPGVPG
jgi:hypothetical protein